MDLIEAKHGSARRHPWETARLSAILRLMGDIPSPAEGLRVLDVGCGDGYVSRSIAASPRVFRVTAVDINLSGERLAELSAEAAKVRFENRYERLSREGYDLALLLDILEHVADDDSFLAGIARDFISPGGFALITVPAFPFLFGSHDRYLGHQRRYGRKDLVELACRAGLEHRRSGFLFLSPLLVRFLSSAVERIPSLSRRGREKGVGGWNGGAGVSWILDRVLRAENLVLIAAARGGVRIPGLSAWMLCRKPR